MWEALQTKCTYVLSLLINAIKIKINILLLNNNNIHIYFFFLLIKIITKFCKPISTYADTRHVEKFLDNRGF